MGDFECSICFLMKLLSWNIRGLGKAEKQGRIKKLLKDRHIDVVFFQETKKAVVSEIAARGLWGSRNMEYMSVDPEGTAGGYYVFGTLTYSNSLVAAAVRDHCPLLMMEDDRDWGSKPFRFLNAWTLHPNFSQLFVTFWTNTTFAGWSGFMLLQKLKHLKLVLKTWNTEVFGNIFFKIKTSEEELHAMDIIAEESALVASEKARRMVVRGELWKLYRMVEWISHQKSRLNWTLNKDKNTRFFHVVTSTRPSRNLINSISVNGVSFEELSRVRHQFSVVEVLAAVKECNNNKAPGPEVFNLLCYQKFWKVMKPDIMQFFKDFHSNSRLTYGINSTFITLIPKLENPIGLSDYRPISLVGSICKILARVLSHRLKSVLPSIIGETQTTFIHYNKTEFLWLHINDIQ
ncbi:uncharacterized protein LOC114316678 [Camellia sinensis]|uniref:uncharacterized protein LOC114316678 n=1 Tax=Camellia sinensis TaxID=4442 RepID=UPI001035B416|nr:uncharacterized protein LOC114316678 [Camellia sinensis]